MNKNLFFIVSILFFSHAPRVCGTSLLRGVSLLRVLKPRMVMTLEEYASSYHLLVIGKGHIFSYDKTYVVCIFKEDSPFVADLKSNIQTNDHFVEWICMQGKEWSSRAPIRLMLDRFFKSQNINERLQRIIFDRGRPEDIREYHLLVDLRHKVIFEIATNNHAFFDTLK